MRAEDGESVDTAIADAIVREPADLVSIARRPNQSVCCCVV
ncbi:hypothetical protein [Streptomyces sp. NPDC093105]